MTAVAPGAFAPHANQLFDFDSGSPLRVQRVHPKKVTAVMTFGRLRNIVPDPRKAEDAKFVARSEANVRAYAALRNEIQRMIEGNKAKNVYAFASYIAKGIRGELGDGWSLPTICLWSPDELQIVDIPAMVGQESIMNVPHDAIVIAIDGETQFLALIELNSDPEKYGLTAEQVNKHACAVEFYNGISLSSARQIFHDRNTLEVKPNAAVAISMDGRDPATLIAQNLMDQLELDNPKTGKPVKLGNVVSTRKRQLKKTDPEWLTMSPLRTLIVTTMLGTPGLQFGARPIDEERLPKNIDKGEFETEVKQVVSSIFKRFTADFADRENKMLSNPAVLAGIGVVANRTLSTTSGKSLSKVELIALLGDIDFSRKADLWDGIAGKRTAAGTLSTGGAKEYGYAVAGAIENPDSPEGRRIRGLASAADRSGTSYSD